jgi:hypothetical protein
VKLERWEKWAIVFNILLFIAIIGAVYYWVRQ